VPSQAYLPYPEILPLANPPPPPLPIQDFLIIHSTSRPPLLSSLPSPPTHGLSSAPLLAHPVLHPLHRTPPPLLRLTIPPPSSDKLAQNLHHTLAIPCTPHLLPLLPCAPRHSSSAPSPTTTPPPPTSPSNAIRSRLGGGWEQARGDGGRAWFVKGRILAGMMARATRFR